MDCSNPHTPDAVLNFPHDHKRELFLGIGSEGTVEAWIHKHSRIVLAIKIIKHQNSIPAEVNILKDLPPHPSVIQFKAFYKNAPRLDTDALLFEYCEEGDLQKFREEMISINKAVFSEAFMWSVFSQMSDALAFLHEGVGAPAGVEPWQTICHRDIKTQNILISTLGKKEDHSGIVIKLADFRLSALYNPASSRMPGFWGTTIFWPPEQTWEGRESTPAGDVWAVGSVIHELAHGFPPILSLGVFSEAWLKENRIPEGWNETKIMSFFGAGTPRKVLPIDIELGCQEMDARHKRPCPTYSYSLNGCMMAALAMDIENRATAGSLQRKIEEAYAETLFEELRCENEELRRELQGSSSEEDWDN